MPMVDSLYQNMVVCVESIWKIICKIISDPNPHEHARPKYSHDFQKCLDKTKIDQQEMGHTYTEIQLYREEDTAIFISHFRILSSFFERHFWCILIFTIWVLSITLQVRSEERRVV